MSPRANKASHDGGKSTASLDLTYSSRWTRHETRPTNKAAWPCTKAIRRFHLAASMRTQIPQTPGRVAEKNTNDSLFSHGEPALDTVRPREEYDHKVGRQAENSQRQISRAGYRRATTEYCAMHCLVSTAELRNQEKQIWKSLD